MTTFNDKEKAAENKFAHDQETLFRIHARRNRLIGLWAAEKLGITGDKANEYARALLGTTLDLNSDSVLLANLQKDFQEKGVSVTEHDIKAQLHALEQEAKKQISG